MNDAAMAVGAVLFVVLVSCSHEMPETPVSPDIWNPRTGKLRWASGEVTLPQGLRYRASQNPYSGQFASRGFSLQIPFIIAGCDGAERWKASRGLREERVNGASVWVLRHEYEKRGAMHQTIGYVEFPDSECASFTVVSSNAERASVVDGIVKSYRRRVRSGAGGTSFKANADR